MNGAFESSLQTSTVISSVFKNLETYRHKKGEKPWPIFENGWVSYFLKSFQDVVPKEGIGVYLKTLSENKKRKLRALDIAGQGNALMELKKVGMGSVDAITLNDFRTIPQKVRNRFQKLKLISGSIADETTRQKIKGLYDLITCRPAGAAVLFDDPQFIFDLLNLLYVHLNDRGIMFIQLSPNMLKVYGTGWIQQLADTKGISVKYHQNLGFTPSLTSFGPNPIYLPELSVIRHSEGPSNILFLNQTSPNPTRRVIQIQGVK